MPHRRTTPQIFHRAKALRRAITPAERKLWKYLRNHQLNGLGFRRQHALGNFIVDFCCPECKYVIELDGDTHANQMEYDEVRTEWLQKYGWKVLRFPNRDVEKNIEGVLKVIAETLTPSRPPPSVNPQMGEE
jgi:very-short-patch-repair endonuclease